MARWSGVPRVTDARFVGSPEGRPRHGLGGWIALWVAGETVAVAGLRPTPSPEERAALTALGLCDDDGAKLAPRATVLPWRGVVVASPSAEAFDVSALNVAASIDLAVLAPTAAPGGGPSDSPAPRSVWDVGCGAGLLTLVAARAGAAVFASDVDETIVAWARLNLGLNGRDADLGVGDLFAAAPPERRFDLVMFNAPLLRAPLAVADEMPRYLAAPRAEALALGFLDGLGARLTDGGRALLHAQLTPPVDAALADWGRRAAVTSVVFAHAPDGTPHALTEIRSGAAPPPGRRRVFVPLSPACPHLARPIFAALAAPRDLADDATPLPAPWLELRTSERYDGGRCALGVTFGAVPVDADDLALLDRLRGEALGSLGLSSTTRERLCAMIDRGMVILR